MAGSTMQRCEMLEGATTLDHGSHNRTLLVRLRWASGMLKHFSANDAQYFIVSLRDTTCSSTSACCTSVPSFEAMANNTAPFRLDATQ